MSKIIFYFIVVFTFYPYISKSDKIKVQGKIEDDNYNVVKLIFEEKPYLDTDYGTYLGPIVYSINPNQNGYFEIEVERYSYTGFLEYKELSIPLYFLPKDSLHIDFNYSMYIGEPEDIVRFHGKSANCNSYILNDRYKSILFLFYDNSEETLEELVEILKAYKSYKIKRLNLEKKNSSLPTIFYKWRKIEIEYSQFNDLYFHYSIGREITQYILDKISKNYKFNNDFATLNSEAYNLAVRNFISGIQEVEYKEEDYDNMILIKIAKKHLQGLTLKVFLLRLFTTQIEFDSKFEKLYQIIKNEISHPLLEQELNSFYIENTKNKK